MARNSIESDFRSSKMGGGGRASQWPACKPFGDIRSIFFSAMTQTTYNTDEATWGYPEFIKLTVSQYFICRHQRDTE